MTEIVSTSNPLITFSEALTYLKAGHRVSRQGWNGKGMWLGMIHQGEWNGKVHSMGNPNSQMLAFIYMYTADGNWVPWLASQTDLLAEDWTNLGA